MTWPTDTWLKDNYYNNNGLPFFFVQGQYGFENQSIAIQEYKDSVTRAANSSNTAYSSWAKDIIKKNFSILSNADIKDYWLRVLIDENSKQQEGQYHKLIFDNLYQNNFLAERNKKRKQQDEINYTSTQRPRIEFKEVDDLIIPSAHVSIGSYIGTLARNQAINDRKSRYFVTCGMNNIIDISDFSQGSQLDEFRYEITSLIPANNISLTSSPSELNSFENIIKNQAIRDDNYEKYYKKCLEKIKAVNTKDKFEIIKDLYEFVFKLHRFHKYIFNPTHQPFAEQDFVLKVWSPVIEIVLRSLDNVPPIIAHWGDTTPEIIKEDNKIIRMDLRLIACQPDEIIDTGVAEFAPKIFKSKHYRDKLKMILACKAQLNSLIKNFSDLDDDSLRNQHIPFMTIMGFECEIYTLRLIANGLYAVDIIHSMTFPSSAVSLQGDGLKNIVDGLFLIKSLCNEVKNINNRKKDFLNKKNKKSQKEIRGIESSNNVARADWSRDLWYPPPYDSDAD